MVIFNILDFTDHSAFTKYLPGGGFDHLVVDSNPLQFRGIGSTTYGGKVHYEYALPAALVKDDATEFKIYVRWQPVPISTQTHSGYIGFKPTTGSIRYVGMALSSWNDAGLEKVRIDTYDTATRDHQNDFAQSAHNATVDPADHHPSEWHWMLIKKNGNNFTFFYAINSLSRPVDEDFTEFTAGAITRDIDASTQIVIGAFSETIGGGSNNNQYFDDLTIIYGDATIPMENAVIDGVNVKAHTYYARNTVGKIGASAKFYVHDPDDSLVPTIKTALNTITSINETRFYNRIFQGEIKSVDTVTKEITAKGLMNKLFNIDASLDPVQLKGTVEHIIGNTLHKKSTGEDVSPVFSGYEDQLISFEKNNENLIDFITHPVATATIKPSPNLGDAYSPDAETGDVTKLFYDIEYNGVDTDLGWNLRGATTDEDFIAVMDFEVWLIATSTINKLKFEARWRTNPGGGHEFYLYNYDTPAWDDKQIDYGPRSGDNRGPGDRDDWGIDQSNKRVHTLDLTSSITDYISEGAPNSNGLSKHTFRLGVRIWGPGDLDAAQKSILHIDYAHVQVVVDTPQQYETSVAKILTVNNHNLVFYEHGSQSWQPYNIVESGIVAGDTFYISKKLADIATDMHISSGLNLIMDLYFDFDDEIPDVDDLSQAKVGDVYEKWSEIGNTAYWIDYSLDPANILPTLRFTKTFTTFPVTINDTIIKNYKKYSTYKVDVSNLRDTIEVFGKNGIRVTQAVTPEFAAELGNEVATYYNNELVTVRQAFQYAASKLKLHESATRIFLCEIDLDSTTDSFTNFNLGVVSAVKIPAATGLVVNHTSGNDEPLFLYSWELYRNLGSGMRNIIKCYFIRRYV